MEGEYCYFFFCGQDNVHTYLVGEGGIHVPKEMFFFSAAAQITDASAGWESCMRKEYTPLILISAAH